MQPGVSHGSVQRFIKCKYQDLKGKARGILKYVFENT